MTEEMVETRELRLVDKHGNLRAVLATSQSDGLPYLQFYAQDDSVPPMTSSIDPNGTPHICLFRKNKCAIAIGLSEDGAGISVHDRQGVARLRIEVPDDSNPFVELLDGGGDPIWEAP